MRGACCLRQACRHTACHVGTACARPAATHPLCGLMRRVCLWSLRRAALSCCRQVQSPDTLSLLRYGCSDRVVAVPTSLINARR